MKSGSLGDLIIEKGNGMLQKKHDGIWCAGIIQVAELIEEHVRKTTKGMVKSSPWLQRALEQIWPGDQGHAVMHKGIELML